ncbi:male-specific lethal 3 homolog [Aplysia californica]|uniref:Male-specific lethal 3 homolog n=1 Tax=Aplysia californica TaxID=6500 RepID=A0ABM0JZ73_APLCA|nr:male-specific lethal 3 homolog [Aplysia californica]
MAGRSLRFEYDIGEIVLCFEPDPTKARVLYEAKVVEQRTVKDSAGKKRPAYVVHFQGWNSSWDRQVGDSYVLRDTVENRELMRKLADTAKKFCRKNSQRRQKINAILHQAFGGAPPDFGSVSESDDTEEESETGKRPGRSKSSQDKKKQKTSLVEFEIPDSLKVQLEDDFVLINKKSKLTQVPAKPCVVDILESFMKTFCVNYLCDPSGGREKTRNSSSKHTLKCPPDKCVSLCKEFVDSLRVIFDFTLPVILLYAAEQQQYETALKDIKPSDSSGKDMDGSSNEMLQRGERFTSSSSHPKGKSEKLSKQQQQELSSPVPSSHSSTSLPQDKAPLRRVTRQAAMDVPRSDVAHGTQQQNSQNSPHPPKSRNPSGHKSPKHPGHSSPKATRRHDKDSVELHHSEPIIPIASRTRRRSQFDTAEVSGEVLVKQEPGSDSEIELCLPTLPSPSQPEVVTTNGLEGACSAAGTESMTMGSSRGREDAMDRILGWQLLPHDVKVRNPITPSQIYGIVHLLRMFVKLPDLLKKMKMKEVQLQIIIKFIHHCLQYLVDHQNELFHDQTYVKA